MKLSMYSLSLTFFFLVQLTLIMNLETERCGADLHSTLTNGWEGWKRQTHNTKEKHSTSYLVNGAGSLAGVQLDLLLVQEHQKRSQA